MDEQQEPDKVPWPGLVAQQKCCWYVNGLISDRSGYDAINEWGRTATQEEKEARRKEAEALGFLEGYAFGYTAVKAFFRLFFG